MRSSTNQTGFTLIELLVTLAVLAIMATVAVPSFTRMIRENEASTEANNIAAGMGLARSEAVRMGNTVSISGLNGSFANGWCVHTQAACTDGSGSTDDTRIRVSDAPSSTVSSSQSRIAFSARGERAVPASGASNPTVSIEPRDCESGDKDRRRILTVGVSGRTEIRRGDCQ